jgi:uncharacterized membrane protein YagU involved in acid resistance
MSTSIPAEYDVDSGLVVLNRRPGVLARVATGALAGVVATLPMTLTMLRLHRLLPPEEKQPLPPRYVTDKLAAETGIRDDIAEDQMTALTLLSHFAYGGLAGAVFGLIAHRVPRPLELSGMAFGLLVWLDAYLGWLPLARLYPPATSQPARRNLLMIVAHLVWGITTGATTALFLNLRREPIRDET